MIWSCYEGRLNLRHINSKHYLARLIVEYFFRGLKHVINTRFFYTQRLFLTQPQRCLTFYWTEPQMLFKSCLIDIDLMLPWLFLDLLYFLFATGLLIYCPYDLFFIIIANMKKYLQSDWLRCVQYWPYLYSAFNICIFCLDKKKQKIQHSMSVVET